MQISIVAGAIAAILYGVYYMIRRGQADKVLSELTRQDRTEEQDNIAALTQEVKDAKVDYARSRVEYNQSIAGTRGSKMRNSTDD